METSKLIRSSIKKVREEHRLNQDEVATAVGISSSAYRKIECGCRNLTLDNAIRLAEFYQMSMDELLLGKKPSSEQELMEMIGQLDEADREEMLHLIRFKLRKK